MKSILSIVGITALAVALVAGCKKGDSNISTDSTNSVTDGTRGIMSSNMPATNAVQDVNQNMAAPANTNQ